MIEILVPDPTYDHPERSKDAFLEELRQDLADLSKEYELTDADAGYGADWPVILASIGGLLFLGKPINENLDAWIALAKKFTRFVAKVRQKWSAPRVD